MNITYSIGSIFSNQHNSVVNVGYMEILKIQYVQYLPNNVNYEQMYTYVECMYIRINNKSYQTCPHRLPLQQHIQVVPECSE